MTLAKRYGEAVISIHALLAESDLLRYGSITSRLISIHALLAESDQHVQSDNAPYDISIHALLAESDYPATYQKTAATEFLSTLSLRRATRFLVKTSRSNNHFYPRSPCGERLRQQCEKRTEDGISIHALLAESDGWAWAKTSRKPSFLSTLSLRRATHADTA